MTEKAEISAQQPDVGPAKHRERIRARYLRVGISGLADYEVVELLLTLAIPRRDVKPAARELVRRFGNVRGVLTASTEELADILGPGTVAPTALHFIRDLAGLYLRQEAEGSAVLQQADALQTFWRAHFAPVTNEEFHVAYLDSGMRVMRNGVERLAEGTIDRVAVYPRRIVEAALMRRAAGVVLAHNHPNGRAEPSDHDKTLTRAVVLAATTVGLRVIDHVIVAGNETFSFREHGLL